MLEDLVAAAFNDAVRKAGGNKSREKMSALTAGTPLPPGLDAILIGAFESEMKTTGAGNQIPAPVSF